jgi:hypothetical protein
MLVCCKACLNWHHELCVTARTKLLLLVKICPPKITHTSEMEGSVATFVPPSALPGWSFRPHPLVGPPGLPRYEFAARPSLQAGKFGRHRPGPPFALDAAPGKDLFAARQRGAVATAGAALFPSAPGSGVAPVRWQWTLPTAVATRRSPALGLALQNSEDALVKESQEGAVDVVKVRNLASGLWRAAWRSLWIQGLLSLVASMFFSCSAAIQLLSPVCSAASGGLYAAGGALCMQMVSMFWTWGYTRAAARLLVASGGKQSAAAVARGDGGVGSGGSASPAEAVRLCRGVRRSMDVGVALALIAALLSVVCAQQVLGTLSVRILVQRGVDPEYLGPPPTIPPCLANYMLTRDP